MFVCSRGGKGRRGRGHAPRATAAACRRPLAHRVRAVLPVAASRGARCRGSTVDLHSNNIVLLAAAFGAVVEEEAEEEEAEVEKNEAKEEVALADDTGLFAAPIRWWNGIPARARG